MLDYVLFDKAIADEFENWLKSKQVPTHYEVDDECYIVSIDEEQPKALVDEIEQKYDELLVKNEETVSELTGEDDYHMAGISIELKDGSVSYADVDPKLMGKIFSVLTPEEFNRVVEAIAQAVETPQSETYCKRQRNNKAAKQ